MIYRPVYNRYNEYLYWVAVRRGKSFQKKITCINKKKRKAHGLHRSHDRQFLPPPPSRLPVTTSLTYIVLIYSDFLFICIDVSQTCLQQAAAGSCGFYDCFEQRFPCGNCGFNKHYSTYDCEKFYLPVYYNQFNDLVSKSTRSCQVFGLSDMLRRKRVLIRNGKSG